MAGLWTVVAIMAGQVGYLASDQAGYLASDKAGYLASDQAGYLASDLTLRQAGQRNLDYHHETAALTASEPEFGIAPNLTKVQVESSAFLHCPVVDTTQDSQVSWIRRRDWHIMSHGDVTYTSDDRVHVKYHKDKNDWVLQIKFAKQRDAGLYECQVTTAGGKVKYRQVQLEVITPEALILGKEEYHIQQGSLISLICILENSLLPPDYVFWYQNDKMINFDSNRGVTVQTTTGRKTSSKLNIKSARPEHSGNYTCKPSSSIPASIQVFVLGDQTGALTNSATQSDQLALFVSAVSLALRGCY